MARCVGFDATHRVPRWNYTPGMRPAKDAAAMELLRTGDVLDRMVRAVEQVRRKLVLATGALRAQGVEYALVGGNAVAAWVATVDEGAVRNTQDVNIMIRREDLARMRAALESAGMVYRHAAGLDFFLESPEASPRQGVHVVFAGELVRPHEPASNPDLSDVVEIGGVRVIGLAGLVSIKLTAFRDKDRTHLRDMIDVGLVDRAWVARLPAELAARLTLLLDTPGG
jgi:hypothetical protein